MDRDFLRAGRVNFTYFLKSKSLASVLFFLSVSSYVSIGETYLDK